jgi:hypothetical protein
MRTIMDFCISFAPTHIETNFKESIFLKIIQDVMFKMPFQAAIVSTQAKKSSGLSTLHLYGPFAMPQLYSYYIVGQDMTHDVVLFDNGLPLQAD